jgi:hypothetical protein
MACDACGGESTTKWLRIGAIAEQDKPLPTVWIATGKLSLQEEEFHED